MSKDNKVPTSFVGKTGKFYVRQRRTDGNFHDRITVWLSVDDYNLRRPSKLTFCNTYEAMSDFDYELSICPQTLTTNWPIDRDETDLGLTPIQSLWAERLHKAKEGRLNAA